jgi:hypothetical protein
MKIVFSIFSALQNLAGEKRMPTDWSSWSSFVGISLTKFLQARILNGSKQRQPG